MFRPVDREARIYQRMPASTDGGLRAGSDPRHWGSSRMPARAQSPFRPALDAAIHREALERLAPPSVLVDESFRVANLSETAGRYLQPSAGPLVNDIVELVREELRTDLRAVLQPLSHATKPSLSGPIGVRFNGARHRVYLQARPRCADPNGKRLGARLLPRGRVARRRLKRAGADRGACARCDRSSSFSRNCSSPSRSCALARGIRGRERGVARRQRGIAVDQRGVPFDRARSSKPARRNCSRSTRSCRRSTAS